MTDEQIKHMVDRFLGWRLPENFNPDAGISFARTYNEHTPYPMKHEPVGTNLFDASQADQMVRYMVEGMPRPQQSAEPIQLFMCEIPRLTLKPGLPYIFGIDPECEKCAAYISGAASSGPSELVEEMEKLEAELTHTGRSATSYEEGFHDGQNQCADRLSALITRHRGKS